MEQKNNIGKKRTNNDYYDTLSSDLVKIQREKHRVDIRKTRTQKDLNRMRERYLNMPANNSDQNINNNSNSQYQQKLNCQVFVKLLDQNIQENSFDKVLQLFIQIQQVMQKLSEQELQLMISELMGEGLDQVLLSNYDKFIIVDQKQSITNFDLLNFYLIFLINITHTDNSQHIINMLKLNIINILQKIISFNNYELQENVLFIVFNVIISCNEAFIKFEESELFNLFMTLTSNTQYLLQSISHINKNKQESQLVIQAIRVFAPIVQQKKLDQKLTQHVFNFITNFVNKFNYKKQHLFNECLKNMIDYQQHLKDFIILQIIHSLYYQSLLKQIQSQCLARNKIAIFNIIYFTLIQHTNLVFNNYISEEANLLQVMNDNLNSINFKIQDSVLDILSQVVDLSTNEQFLQLFEDYFLMKLIQILQTSQNEEQQSLIIIIFIKYLRRPSFDENNTLILIQNNILQTIQEILEKENTNINLMIYSIALLYVILEQTYEIQIKYKDQTCDDENMTKVYDIIIDFMIKYGLKQSLEQLENSHKNQQLCSKIKQLFTENPKLE